MKLCLAAVSAALILSTPAFSKNGETTETADAAQAAQNSKKPKKISDRRHPDYVRCRSEPIMGSLAKKRRICMTNTEWVAYTRTGSRDSKEFVEDSQPGFMITPN